MEKIKLAIVDDHEGHRKDIVKYLKNSFYDRIEIGATVKDETELIEKLKTYVPHIVIVGLKTPRMSLKATKILRAKYPEIKIIAVSDHSFEEDVLVMTRLGVKSFISKHEYDLLRTAINVVYDGHVFLPREIARIIQSYLPEKELNATHPRSDLSEFELVLLKLISKGLSSTEIGIKTCKSPRTIEGYRERLYKKFNVNSKERLLIEAMRLRLI